jgi:septum formation protein
MRPTAPPESSPPPLILASTSRYRRELLARLGMPFTVEAPGVDEARQPGEAPRALVARLAEEKALAVARRHPGAAVIGSDQLAWLPPDAVLGKPGGRDAAIAQLLGCAGRTVRFLTALHLVRVADDGGAVAASYAMTDVTEVRFRALDRAEIARYVDREQPYDCAGGFKCEGLGIALFEGIRSEDPTALIGLPMIAVAEGLRRFGLDPL